MNKLFICFASFLLSLTLLITATQPIAYANPNFQTPSDDIISSVNGVEITVTDFQERYHAEKWLYAFQVQRAVVLANGNTQLTQSFFTLLYIPQPYTHMDVENGALSFLQDEEAFALFTLEKLEIQTRLEQLIDERDIVIDNAAIKAVVDEFMVKWSGVELMEDLSDEDKQAMLNSFEAEFYQWAQTVADVDEAMIEQIFYYEALVKASRYEVTADVIPTQTIWVESRHIVIIPDATQSYREFDPALCETDAWQTAKLEADVVYDELQKGASFIELAEELSDDNINASDGGALGWADAEYDYIEPFADAVLSAEIGVVTEPVCSQLGWHIIEVLDREMRPVPPAVLITRQEDSYQAWLNDALRDAEVQRANNWTDHIPANPSYDELWDAMFAEVFS